MTIDKLVGNQLSSAADPFNRYSTDAGPQRRFLARSARITGPRELREHHIKKVFDILRTLSLDNRIVEKDGYLSKIDTVLLYRAAR